MPFLSRPYGCLYYRVEGPAGAPWLVLSNALGTDFTLWRAQLPQLTRHFRVLCYDTRGHGHSSAAAGDYTLDELGRDVLALCDALDIAQTHVCGISLGGLTAMWLALHAPGRVQRIVLANTAACIATPAAWSERIRAVQQAGLGALADASIERWFSTGFRLREKVLAADFRRRLLATRRAGYLGCCAALRAADLRGAVAEIRSDALVIAGCYDCVTTRDDARDLAAAIPHADRIELPAAHLSNVEAADGFTRAVAGFLRTASRSARG